MSSALAQSCPCCGCDTRPNSRYPNYVCRDCVERAVAPDGRLVHFTNASPDRALPGMAVAATYRDDGSPCATDYCSINGVECRAREARFGGVVIQPLATWAEHGQL